MRYRLVALIAVSMVVVACGGGEADTAGEEQPVVTTSTAPTETGDTGGEEAEETGADDDTPAASDSGLTVTIEGATYQFELLECGVRENGSLSGSGHSPDFSMDVSTGVQTGASLFFHIQVEGSPNQEVVASGERHYVNVIDHDEDLTWNAGAAPFLGSVTYDDSYVDSWTLDGTSASGTAFFIEEGVAYDQGATVVSLPGEFSFDCGG